MRRVLVLALMAMVMPIAAWADGITLTNIYGTVQASTSGIISKGSQLTSFNGITPPPGKSLGSVSFSTGALLSGSLLNGGTFSATGSTFTVIGKGNYGQPKGTIFSGSFVGPITLTLDSVGKGGGRVYTLSGAIQGMLYNGRIVSGTTSQTLTSTGPQWGAGIGHIKVGSTNLTVPEPGTLGLLGTGLVGIAGMFRRKLMGA